MTVLTTERLVNRAQLTLDEEVSLVVLPFIQQRLAFAGVVVAVVKHTLVPSVLEDRNDGRVHLTVTFELLVSFKVARDIVKVTLVDGGHATELLVIIHGRILAPRLDYGLCNVKCDRNNPPCTLRTNYLETK